jgi:outer membrane protein
MKSISIIFVFVLLYFNLNEAFAQRFGYISSSDIVAEMSKRNRVEDKLKSLQTKLVKQAQNKADTVQMEYQKLVKKMESGELTPKQQEDGQKRLQEMQNDLQAFERSLSEQIDRRRTELLTPLYEQINQAINDVAQENGLEMILDESVLLYGTDRINLTSAVARKLGLANN